MRLISGLLDSDKQTEGYYLVISGNWYSGGTHCPIVVGRAGG